jgi:hypothetical protein
MGRPLLAALVTLALTGVRVEAQARARVEGFAVEPTTGLGIPNVEVRLLGTDRTVRTDSLGSFRLSIDAGHYLVRATRLGFGPRSVALDLGAGDTVTVSIEMDVLPVQLSEVMVKAREDRYRGKMAGFAQRMHTSAAPRSSFITRDEIERKAPRQVSDLMVNRGGRVASCFQAATIYVDGVMVPSDKIGAPVRGRRTEPIQRDLRLDHIPPQEIEAIEVYAGAATTPSEYLATAAPGLAPGCTILIWTR